MSKAFTKESDEGLEFDESAADAAEEAEARLAGGRPNYITPRGFKALQEEYQQLFSGERPKLVEVIAWAASNGDRSENGDYIYGKRRLREIDRRLKFLSRRMASAVVVPLGEQSKDQVLFGATVMVEDEDGKKVTYKIVGEDEIDINNRKISWISPVAHALLGKKVGDAVTVQRPSGEAELVILKIEYIEE
jgi:transcription elongation factor GreB